MREIASRPRVGVDIGPLQIVKQPWAVFLLAIIYCISQMLCFHSCGCTTLTHDTSQPTPHSNSALRWAQSGLNNISHIFSET